jgi:hypothetical protein
VFLVGIEVLLPVPRGRCGGRDGVAWFVLQAIVNVRRVEAPTIGTEFASSGDVDETDAGEHDRGRLPGSPRRPPPAERLAADVSDRLVPVDATVVVGGEDRRPGAPFDRPLP